MSDEIELTQKEIDTFEVNCPQVEVKASFGYEYPVHTVLQNPNDKYSGRTVEGMTMKSAHVTVGILVDVDQTMDNGIDKAYAYARQKIRYVIQIFQKKLESNTV